MFDAHFRLVLRIKSWRKNMNKKKNSISSAQNTVKPKNLLVDAIIELSYLLTII